MDQINFSVPDMHCEHCEAVVSAELTAVTASSRSTSTWMRSR